MSTFGLRRKLTLRYGIGLALIGVLFVASYVGLTQLIHSQQTDAPTINVSGRQRMLSQRVSLLALRYASVSDPTERARIADLLDQAIGLMASSHQALTNGSEALGISQTQSLNVEDLYEGSTRLSGRVAEYLKWAEGLRQLPAGELRPDHPLLLQMLAQSEKPLLADLNQAVSLYEAESSSRVGQLAQVQLYLLLVALGLILLEAGFIFRPMVESIVNQVQELQRSSAVIREQREAMQLVLDNTSGALFMVNEAGVIQPGWSAKVTEWFGSVHTDKPYWMMLFESSNEQVKTEMAYGQLVADWLPHELALEQMPSALERGGRYLNVAYSRIHRTSEEVSESPGYLVTIEDVTAEREAAMARRQAQELPNILMRLFEGRAVFEAFCYDTERLFTEAKASVNLDDDLKTLARVLHTLKGNTAIFGFRSLSEAIHEVETRMEVAEDFDLKAEIEDLRARWSEDLERIRPYAGEPSDKGILLTLDEFEGHLDHIASGIPTGELVAEVQRWRDEPVTGQLRQLADAADRIADRLGKEVTVITESNGVRIPDPGCLAEFWSSLVHVVRNAVDHGVEDAEVRKASGKPPAATIRLSCDRRSGWLQVVVADDGPGVPWERLIAKAKANGVDYDDRDLSTLLFAQGLSSRDEVTQVSGRGVGMAAVRETLTALGGRVEVTSEPGVGTHFSFEVPLTNGGVPQGAQREPEVTA